MGAASLLSGLLGGGGFSSSPSSSTSQASPFYNDSGIYFDSPGGGQISGNPISTSATSDPSRANTGGLNAMPTSTFIPPSSAASSSSSLLYLGIAAAIASLIGLYLFLEK